MPNVAARAPNSTRQGELFISETGNARFLIRQWHVAISAGHIYYLKLEELELELIQAHMTQKPLLWVEAGAQF
jgi:hypothetical protein